MKNQLQDTTLFVQLVKDLEETRWKYNGYAYVRTIRNILVGKEDALIAPYFSDKPYYGLIDNMSLEDVEKIMDSFVKANLLEYTFTEHGKLYCTKEYHNELRR